MALPLISRLWSHARDALTRLRSSILPLGVLDKKERRHLGRWLGALEAFARRIVLLEALSLERVKERGSSLSAEARRAKAEAPQTHTPIRKRKRPPRLRLWPKPKRTGPRARLLGRPTLVSEIWREQRRAALIARLAAVRGKRRQPHIILADRIDALESLLAAPLRAARRLARKLAQRPRLAIKLAMAKARSAPGLDDALLSEAQGACWPQTLALNSS